MNIKPETQYQVAINKNNSEGEIQWNRYNAMLVVNTIFIALIGLTYKNEVPLFIRFTLSPLGIFLCLLWYQITKRGFMWINFWIEKAREIEEKFSNKNNINPITKGNKYRSSNKKTFNTELSSYIVIGIFIFIYLLIFANDILPIICALCQKK